MLRRIQEEKWTILEALLAPILLLSIAAMLESLGDYKVLNIQFLSDIGSVIKESGAIIVATSLVLSRSEDCKAIGICSILGIITYEVAYKAGLGFVKMEEAIQFQNTGIIRGLILGSILIKINAVFSEKFPSDGEGDRSDKIYLYIATFFLSTALGMFLGVFCRFVSMLIQPIVDFLFIGSDSVSKFFYTIFDKLTLVLGINHVFQYGFWQSFLDRIVQIKEAYVGLPLRDVMGDDLARGYITTEYIISIFCLPGALVALYKSMNQAKKKEIIIYFISGGLASILTGWNFIMEIVLLVMSPVYFVVYMIISGVAAILCNFFNVTIELGKNSGLIECIFNIDNNDIWGFIIPIGIGLCIVQFIFQDKIVGNKSERVLKNNDINSFIYDFEIVCPMNGELLELEDVPDKDFSDKINGDGFAILPNSGMIYAPVDGRVNYINIKKKIIRIGHKSGVEIMINFGVESSVVNEMECEFYVQEGQKIRRKDLLMKVDIGNIESDVASIITPVVFMNLPESKEVEVHPGKKIKMGEKNIIRIKDKSN